VKSVFRSLIYLLALVALCGAAEKSVPKKPAVKKKAPVKKSVGRKIVRKKPPGNKQKSVSPKKKKYPGKKKVKLLEAALQGPLNGVEEIIFVNRNTYNDPHWYANIGYWCDDETRKMYPGEGKVTDGTGGCKGRHNPRSEHAL